MKLAPGESSPPVQVHSRKIWNATGIEVAAGERYAFRAQGEWTDFTIDASPKGYATMEAPGLSRKFLSFFEHARRMPGANWFALIGAIGQDETSAFLIGERREDWEATGNGELMCFANDVRMAYFNNCGSVTLTITRR